MLLVNHAEMLDDNGMEWSMTTEEVLGGAGRATLVVQDRTNTWEPEPHWDVQVVVRGTGWVLWRGEIVTEPEELPNKMPWRKWNIDCADYNNELEQRLVGAFDGKTWLDPGGFGFFVNIDPFASSLATDKLTVQQLLDHYIRVDGTALETTTYVNEYLADFFPISWEYSTLQKALEDLAARILDNLQFWVDPDLNFHWITIPAWQDLATDAVTTSIDETVSSMASLGPEAPSDEFVLAPVELSDDGLATGFSDLKFTFDGSAMPEQIYVRGATGYVYNSPPIPAVDETKTVVKAPVPGSPASYELTILATTKLWHVDGTGYVSVTFASVGAGGPWPVKWVSVPWSEARHKGGSYWKFLSGPHAGLLADDDTNVLNGYGSIVVRKVGATPAAPKVGIGGSGWVGEVDQDPNKRQAFLDSPISTDKAARDSFGGQAIYRGKFPTLRGSLVVTGVDGWRVGQLVKISDVRLPTALNGRYFVIQSVRAELIEGQDERKYAIDWGDGPTSRFSQQNFAGDDGGFPPPAIKIDVTVQDISPGASSTQVITGQLVDGSGKPWAIPGKIVNWSFQAYNALGVLQTAEGSLAPTVSITDKHGTARTKLTTGPDDRMVYFVFATVKAT